MLSWASYRASGDGLASSKKSSGKGPSQIGSATGAAGGALGSAERERPGGKVRRGRRSRASRQAFVAILYSHERNDARPSKVPSFCHARKRLSCTRSSASCKDPSI